MNEFLELLKAGNIKEAYAKMVSKDKVEDYAKEFNNARDIRDTQVGKRKDKIVTDGSKVTVAKIPIAFQRQIVKSAATFLFGSQVKLVERKNKDNTNESKKNDAFQAILDLWDDMRMDATLLQFCRAVKSETEASIVFFTQKKDDEKDVKIKSRLITNKNGKVYPVYDEFGDMIAFGWEYSEKDNKFLHLWTAEKYYIFKKAGSDWAIEKSDPNLFKKIPVVYLSQDNPEWWEVEGLIDNYEMEFSKFVDTNGYFSSPMYKAKGAINSIPKKDETGKMVKLDIIETDKGNIIESDIEVISWDRAPEALKLEFEIARSLIFGLSNTPDLSMQDIKGLGNLANYAMELMFLGPIIKAKEAEGNYQTAISRIINVMKAGIGNITNRSLLNKFEELRINVTFTSVLPKNVRDVIETLTEATGGKAVMSQKTAVTHNPLIDDNDEELDNIKAEGVLDLADTVQ